VTNKDSTAYHVTGTSQIIHRIAMKNSSKSKKTDKQETRRLCNASQKFNLVRHELSYYKTYPMIKNFFEPALLQNNQRQKDKKTVSLLVLMRCVCV
jgi:hypothetical protein